MRRLLAAAALVLVLMLGCEAGAPCEDPDRDGYGPGCVLGDDCDPNNANRNDDCVRVPPPDCGADPVQTGCPCLPGAVTGCLSTLDGVGICRAGRTLCLEGFWGACDGGQGPTSERCNSIDDDCDGRTDEGVRSPCGGCDSSCQGGVWGEGADPFEASEGLELTRLGELTLATVSRATGTLWVANSAEGTVSRIDPALAVETARYPSGGTEPARIAVDWAGDAWVVNREFEGVPTATKIAGESARCVDRDGDGVETSTGPADVRAIDQDECVLLHVRLGEAGTVARSIAIDGDRGLDEISGGNAWIGLHDAQEIVEIDGLDGHVRTRVATPGLSPYASTFDRWGTLWVIERDGLLARIDVRAEPPAVTLIEVPLPCYLLYGISADPQGRLLMTGFSCDQVVVYDPATGRWAWRAAPASPRAAAPAPDGNVWVAHTSGRVSEVQVDPLRVVRTIELGPRALETVGVAVDALDRVWAISSHGGDGGSGLASRVDPETGTVTAEVSVGTAPHVQGDLTGGRLRYALVPEASASHVFDGCGPEATRWQRVHVDADPGGLGTVEIAARHAARREDLAAGELEILGTIPQTPAPFALSVPDGGVLEIRATLRVSGPAGAPRLRRIGVEWACPGPD